MEALNDSRHLETGTVLDRSDGRQPDGTRHRGADGFSALFAEGTQLLVYRLATGPRD